jgi:hypothetical protein
MSSSNIWEYGTASGENHSGFIVVVLNLGQIALQHKMKYLLFYVALPLGYFIHGAIERLVHGWEFDANRPMEYNVFCF